jgi:hypothetical protein
MDVAVAPLPVDAAPVTTLGESDLRRIEAALLDAILDVRPDRSNAVDRLLDDPALSSDGREQVERLLVAAVMDTHPDRNRALDRLLDDIGGSGPLPAHA